MSAGPPPASLQNPISGTTIDTSPQSLGLRSSERLTQSVPEILTESKVGFEHRGLVKRAVESTAAKLGGSVIGSAAGAVLRRAPLSSSSKRLFSLNRKGKGQEREGERDADNELVSGEDDMATPENSPIKSASSTSCPRGRPSTGNKSDDSPFIRPRSPSSPTSRPSLDAFRGLGSMRAGTQTLIQALQAMPWTDEPDGDDDAVGQPASLSDSSDEEHPTERLLASSIHTIHRPVARSRRQETPSASRPLKSRPMSYFPTVLSSDEDDGPDSDEDDEDFEATPVGSITTRRPKEQPSTGEDPSSASQHAPNARLARLHHMGMSRTASLATVRLKRRAKLADKLKDVFGLDAIEEVVAELPCWLFRFILLQGYMYLTNSHLCFFAHMPAREDRVLKSGSLNKKTQRTKRWIKHWFVLKNDVLSWYQSSSDPYFPHGVIDLRYAISCESVQQKGFRIRTNQKLVTLMADSVPSREEWVKAIRKVIFKAQNMGDSVKIAIPYSVILDVDKSTAMDFSDTIEVKVVDKEDGISIDSYFFAYFHSTVHALDQIRDAVRTYKPIAHNHSILETVHDTTSHKLLSTSPSSSNVHTERAASSPDAKSQGYTSRLASLLRFSSDSTSAQTSSSKVAESSNASKLVPSPSISPKSLHPSITSMSSASPTPNNSRICDSPCTLTPHTYPPTPSPSSLSPIPSRESTINSWNVPSWLKGTTNLKRSFPFGYNSTYGSGGSGGEAGVSEVISPLTPSISNSVSHGGGGTAELGYSFLETKEAAEPEMVDKFRAAFAFDEKETLLGYFPGYLFRLLPAHGRLYVSANYFCFKSSGPLATKTRMILPLRDILSTERSKAYRFGHHGLIIIIKGHEELFFEFGSAERRTAFLNLLQRQIEDSRRRLASVLPDHLSDEQRDALILEELEPSSLLSEDDPRPPPESLTDSLPAVMFTSKSSTFLTFKPQESLHFTLLTIGSRGDVQPYIALAKGLLADGHRVKIATHGEFKEWIESQGIEFGYVGGDPAELMRICVENGMFTVSFLKEGIMKFRGWIDDLLKTAWETCQGTDVLIESPSAMGGIHIAEALKIPYFRAFTMTWTRTRAYPHAFAVPDRKMGGAYNYMSYVMFDQVFWRATSGQINRWRKNVLGLPSTSLDKLEPHKVPFLYNFSPTVVPPPLDWPEWIRVTGYWFLDDAEVGSKKWSPPVDLLDFIHSSRNSGKKIVYIGFGSIVVSDPEAMTRCVVEAIKKSGVHAILSKGWSDRLQVKKGADAAEPEIPLPPQIFSIGSAPHDWLFKRIDAACHHGGAGTTGASLRAGIPTIIKPFFGDQFFWADRVEALGIGSGVRKLTVESLTDALIHATTDVKQIDRAKLIGEQIRAENGVATAVEAIYRDLEYARSLIKSTKTEEVFTSSEEEGQETARSGTLSRSILSTPERLGHSSYDSNPGAPGDDWSVISDQEDKRSSRQSGDLNRSPSSKRSSLAAAMFSVLPTKGSRRMSG